MAGAGVKLRAMRKADLAAVVALEQACFAEPWAKRSLVEELAQPGRVYMVARTRGGEVVGYGGMSVLGEDAHILTLAVAPAHRRHGIGTRLVAELASAALESGVRHLTLEVRPSNVEALALYVGFGFESAGRRKGYYRNEDAIVMWSTDIDRPAFRRHLAEVMGEVEKGIGPKPEPKPRPKPANHRRAIGRRSV